MNIKTSQAQRKVMTTFEEISLCPKANWEFLQQMHAYHCLNIENM